VRHLRAAGALDDALPAAGGDVRARGSLADVGRDHSVHASNRVNASALVTDTPLDDLLEIHDVCVPWLKARKHRVVSEDSGYSKAMGIAYPTPSMRLIRLLDAAAIVWVVGWVVLALFVAREVRDLRQLSDTVVLAGAAVEDTGDAVDSLGTLPFVGERVGSVADEVRAAGLSAQASGRESRASIDDLSVLLALAIGLVPTLPLLALYAPLRIAWSRDSRAVRRALAGAVPDSVLLELLARRAVLSRSYEEIRAVSDDPFRDIEEGRVTLLAELELRRLGLAWTGRGRSRLGSPSAPVR
jgi:hypothetical protein